MLTITEATWKAFEIRAITPSTGLAYAGAAPVYAALKNASTGQYWDAALGQWVGAEPAVSSLLATTPRGNGDFAATIPAEAVPLGSAGQVLRLWALTTWDEGAEVLLSEVHTIAVEAAPVVATYETLPFNPAVWNLAKYRAELRESLSQDPNDPFWSNAELVGHINRAVHEIWKSLVAVDPDLYRMRVDPFPLDPETDMEDGVLKVALPTSMYAPTALRVGNVVYTLGSNKQVAAHGFWVEGRRLCLANPPRVATNAVLYGTSYPTPMVEDTDEDSLPDGDFPLKGWIVPLARIFAIEKEQYQTSEEYLKMVAYIKAVIRDSYPVAQRVAHSPEVDTSDSYSGFF